MAVFAGSDSIRVDNFWNENLSIPNVACVGGVQERFEGPFEEIVRDDDNQVAPLNIRSAVGDTPVDMALFFVSYTGDVPVAEKIHLNCMECFFHLIEFGFSDNGFHFFHEKNIRLWSGQIYTK